MPAEDAPSGWAWFATPVDGNPQELELCRAFAHCFAGADGRIGLERRLPPNASDAELRHLEGATLRCGPHRRHGRARRRLTPIYFSAD